MRIYRVVRDEPRNGFIIFRVVLFRPVVAAPRLSSPFRARSGDGSGENAGEGAKSAKTPGADCETCTELAEEKALPVQRTPKKIEKEGMSERGRPAQKIFSPFLFRLSS